MLAKEYIYDDYPIINISSYKGFNEDNIKLFNDNNLIIVINSGLDGNNTAMLLDKGYTEDFKKSIIETVAKNQKHFKVMFY